MNQQLKDHLIELLRGGSAHNEYEMSLRIFPHKWIGEKPAGFTHSAWELLEHIRIAQKDIIHYCLDSNNHVSPTWPDEYWPLSTSPASIEDWEFSINQFVDELNHMIQLINNTNDLLKPLSPNSPHTLCREAMLLADHNSYHLGQLMYLQKYFDCTTISK